MLLCFTCEKEITGSYINNKNKYYHIPCSPCSRCSKLFGNDRFSIKSTQFICNECANLNKCKKCKKSIKNGVGFKILRNEFYHKECFLCEGSCEKPIQGLFHYIQTKKICIDCYKK
jgi:recombinational DNA repair protein (RecF pathway)